MTICVSLSAASGLHAVVKALFLPFPPVRLCRDTLSLPFLRFPACCDVSHHSDRVPFQALVLDVKLAVMYLTDTHVPSIMRGNMRNYTDEGVSVSKEPRENRTSARVRYSCYSQKDTLWCV